eukprot:TRINITY_DN34290_c0_g2_i1.p4 TRINITY_DN34290_c0_g2~~TRINITY_DN34290_c0_g2_i1.p4  ORF type:complete len:171 (-),score=12.53 TRINITY_DN34290_c0_g2_i1:153-665(-)
MEDLQASMNHIYSEVQQQLQEFISQQQKSFTDATLGFFHAIDWTEPWIISILCTHAFLFLLTILFRKILQIQAVLFFTLMVIIYCAEQLNELGAKHWRKFASQPYFDEGGFFISMVVSMPLVVVMLVIVINYLISVAKLLVRMKRQQIRYELRQRQQASANGGVVLKKEE